MSRACEQGCTVKPYRNNPGVPSGLPYLLIFVLSLNAGGCSAGDDFPLMQVVRDSIGDTLVVTTIPGNTRNELGYEEELSIGALEGAPEYTLGSVSCVRGDGRGGVYAFEPQEPALVHFDSSGQYAGTLGRSGNGPGEYSFGCVGLDVFADGRVVLADQINRRVTLYSSDGDYETSWPISTDIPVPDGVRASPDERVSEVGSVMPAGPEAAQRFIVVIRDTGGSVLDTIDVPFVIDEDFRQHMHWQRTILPLYRFGMGIVIPDLDRYAMHVVGEDGGLLQVRRTQDPVESFDEERENWRRYAEFYLARGFDEIRLLAELPPNKPFIRSLRIGARGRLWVTVFTTAERLPDEPVPDGQPPAIVWREPNVYDVFEPDGTLLGRLSLPRNEYVVDSSGDDLWLLRMGEFDENYLVRARLSRGVSE